MVEIPAALIETSDSGVAAIRSPFSSLGRFRPDDSDDDYVFNSLPMKR
jgi:hypothetical protein